MIKWTKTFLATLASFLVCFYSGRFIGFTGFSFAWILNFVLMAWFTYVDSLFNWKYDSSYFDSKSFEKDGAIYRFFGVHLYRKLLVLTGWEKISRKNNKISSSRTSIKHAESKSRSSEAGHTVIFIIVGIVTITVAGTLREALWLILLNLLLNVFPIIVQRYNRPRYRRLLQKMETTSEAKYQS